jgi:hypothetical protein
LLLVEDSSVIGELLPVSFSLATHSRLRAAYESFEYTRRDSLSKPDLVGEDDALGRRRTMTMTATV